MIGNIDKFNYIPNHKELFEEEQKLAQRAIVLLNDKTHSLDLRIRFAAHFFIKHNVPPCTLGVVLANFKTKNIGTCTEQEALKKIFNLYRKNSLPEDLERYSEKNVIQSILVRIETRVITKWKDLEHYCSWKYPWSNYKRGYIKDHPSQDGKFQIASRFLIKTKEDIHEVASCFRKIISPIPGQVVNLGPFSDIQKLKLEWILIQKGGFPQLNEDINLKDFSNSDSLATVFKGLNSLLYPEDLEMEDSEIDELYINDLMNVEFVKKIPISDLYIIIGLLSHKDIQILRKIAENLPLILKNDKAAIYRFSLKIALVLCDYIIRDEIAVSEFISFLPHFVISNPEIAFDNDLNNILHFVLERFQLSRRDIIIEVFKEIFDPKFDPKYKVKLSINSKLLLSLIPEICKGGKLEEINESIKIRFIKGVLRSNTVEAHWLISKNIGDLQISLEEKASLSKEILGNIKQLLPIDKTRLANLLTFIDFKDVEYVLTNTPLDLWKLYAKIIAERNLEYSEMVNTHQPPILEIFSKLIIEKTQAEGGISPASLLLFAQYFSGYQQPKLKDFCDIILQTEIDVENEYYLRGPKGAVLINSCFKTWNQWQITDFIKVLEQGKSSVARDMLCKNLKKQLQWRFLEYSEDKKSKSVSDFLL